MNDFTFTDEDGDIVIFQDYATLGVNIFTETSSGGLVVVAMTNDGELDKLLEWLLERKRRLKL